MTIAELERVKAQLLQGEEALRKHYDFSDISTLVGLLNTCIGIMQSDDDLIDTLQGMHASCKGVLETEKKVNELLMQDVRDKSKNYLRHNLNTNFIKQNKRASAMNWEDYQKECERLAKEAIKKSMNEDGWLDDIGGN